jgi:leucyl aminopeptidase
MPAFLSHTPASDETVGADVLVIPLKNQVDPLHPRLNRIGSGVASAVLRALDLGDFKTSLGTSLLVHSRGAERFPRILLLGLGENPSRAEVRRVFASAARTSFSGRIETVAVLAEAGLGSGAVLTRNVSAAVDGILEGSYRWSAATDEPKGQGPGRFVFLGDTGRSKPRIDSGITEGRSIGSAVTLARDLANTPANRMSPRDLGDRAREIAKGARLSATVLEGPQLVRERLEALRVVGAGSSRDPRLIVLDYKPARSRAKTEPIVLVGKGLVFDTGGLNIKPGTSMVEMKFDKCGACVVLGAMQAISELELPHRVVGIVPAAENSISGESYRPGDIIGSRSGKTIEVLNTDAEGRLVLADALDYAITKFTPRAVIDVATLTGAAYYALGDRACAVLGNDETVVARLREAGDRVGERAWPLPLWREYLEDVKTPNADVRNTGAWGAGTIAGAAFLQRFVGDVPWGHLDVASVSRDRRNPKVGATGFGVRLLVEALRAWPRSRRKVR